MAITHSEENGINTYTQEGNDTDFSDLRGTNTGTSGIGLPGVSFNEQGGTYTYRIDGVFRVGGRIFHNHELERLILSRATTTSNTDADNPSVFRVLGRSSSYWSSLPRNTILANALPTTGTNGSIVVVAPVTSNVASGNTSLHIRENDAWTTLWEIDPNGAILTQLEDRLAALEWTGGNGMLFTGNHNYWNRDTSNTNNARGSAMSIGNGATLYLNGGRILGSIHLTTKRGANNTSIPARVVSWAAATISPFSFATEDNEGSLRATSTDPSSEYLTRLLSGAFIGSGLSIAGGSVSVGVSDGGLIPFARTNSGVGYWMQHSNGSPFNTTSTTSYPTLLNNVFAGNAVDIAPWQSQTANRSGTRVKNNSRGSLVNINGGEVSNATTRARNVGYVWITRELQTAFVRVANPIKMAQTVEGTMYITDTDNLGRAHTEPNALFNDEADSVYTIGFNDAITSYNVTGGTAAGLMQQQQENEILLGTWNLNLITSTQRLRGTPGEGIWAIDRRGVNNSDAFNIDVWSYEQEYIRLSPNLAGIDTHTFTNVINNDAFVSRPRAMALGINNVVASINASDVTSYSLNTGGTLSDIYDFVKYQKDTNGSYRNVPNVTSLPLTASGTTLDLGTRTLNVTGTLSGTSIFDTVSMGNASLAGDITDVTVTSTDLAVGGVAPTYTNSRFNIDNTLILVENTTFNGFTFNTNENISNFGTHLTIGENGLHFQQSTTLSLDNGLTGTIASADLFTGVTIEPTHSLDIITTNSAGVTIEFPLGTTINNGTVSFGGGTLAAGQNVTFAAVQPAAVQPTVVRLDLAAHREGDIVRAFIDGQTIANVREYTIPASNGEMVWSSAVTTGGAGTTASPWPLDQPFPIATTDDINYLISGTTSTPTYFRHTVTRNTATTDAATVIDEFAVPSIGDESGIVAPANTDVSGRDIHIHTPVALDANNRIVVDMSGFTYINYPTEPQVARAFALMRNTQDFLQALRLRMLAVGITPLTAGRTGVDIMQPQSQLYVNLLGPTVSRGTDGAYVLMDLETSNQILPGTYDTGPGFTPRATNSESLQLTTPDLGTDDQQVYSAIRQGGVTRPQLAAELQTSGGVSEAQVQTIVDNQTGAIIGNIYGAS